jgi:2-isopropylmalate synthase
MEMPNLEEDVVLEKIPKGVEKNILISSTTLRDGLQTASAAHVSVEDRVLIAQREEEMGIDITEAAFPGKSDANGVDVIKQVGQNTGRIKVAAMAGWEPESINAAIGALYESGVLMDDRGILHVLLRPSPNLRAYGYKDPVSKENFLTRTRQTAKYVVGRFYERKARGGLVRVRPQIMFYLEQATEAFLDDREFFGHVQEAAVTAVYDEARSLGYEDGEVEVKLSLCETNGGALEDDYPAMFSYSRKNVDRLGRPVILSAHTHNDIGMAVANAVNAVLYGADQVEVTAAGIGEAAGNAQTAAVVAALDLLNQKKGYNLKMGVDRKAITGYERLVMQVIGDEVPPRAPVTGWQVSYKATTAGLHSAAQQNADRAFENGDKGDAPLVYRAMDTAQYGNVGEVFLGSEQGIDALRNGLEELNVYVGPELERKLFARMRDGYKEARSLREYLERELMTAWFVRELQEEEERLNGRRIEVRDLKINIHGGVDVGEGKQQEVLMQVAKWNGGEEPGIEDINYRSSHGPIAAAAKILMRVTDLDFDVVHYEERIADDLGEKSKGAASMTVATFVICDRGGRVRRGFGMNTDSDESKIYALVQALNRLDWEKDDKGKSHPPA